MSSGFDFRLKWYIDCHPPTFQSRAHACRITYMQPITNDERRQETEEKVGGLFTLDHPNILRCKQSLPLLVQELPHHCLGICRILDACVLITN